MDASQLQQLAWWGGGALAVVVVIAVLLRVFRRKNAAPDQGGFDLSVDISELDDSPPPATGPTLHVYGTPVRLAVVVIASAGRGSPIPGMDRVPEHLETMIPGLGRVCESHRPLIKVWPSQLSAQGFAHSFFNQVALPGDRGKNTPWCSVAGRFQADRTLLVGLVGIAAQANGLSQILVQHEGQWLDVVRVQGLAE